MEGFPFTSVPQPLELTKRSWTLTIRAVDFVTPRVAHANPDLRLLDTYTIGYKYLSLIAMYKYPYTLGYNMKQITIVETHKATADYNKKLKFLKKNHYDNVSAMNRTTDGNSLVRYRKDAEYWLLKIKEFEAVKYTIEKAQDEIFKQFNDAEIALNTPTVCKVCDGAEQLTAYQEDENGEKEAVDVVDCICTDDRWDPENQDQCVECEGTGQYRQENLDGELMDPQDCDACNCTGRVL